MGRDNSETLHRFRSGCAITLILSGIKLSEVKDHVGWTQRHTTLYYLQLAKVLNPAGAPARLAQVDLCSLTSEWENLNELKRFVPAFPVDASRKGQTEGSSPPERIGSVALTPLGYDIPGFIDLINLF